MQKKTHIAFGVLLFAILTSIFSMNWTLAVFAALGAFFPDIDWLLDKKYIPAIIKKYTWNLIFKVGIHRTLLHNVWVLTIATYLFLLLSGSWAASTAFAVGIISHLIADSITLSGIYWLWPFGDNRIFGQKRYFFINGPVKTGGASEYAFQTAVYIVSGILFAKKLNII